MQSLVEVAAAEAGDRRSQTLLTNPVDQAA